tara:strand:+ start:533 stop:811 length:279 start_codon:yes stop_codon:yes gene_type:complete
MSNQLMDILLKSPKIQSSVDYDAIYESLPVFIAESIKDLDNAFERLDEAGGHGYVATWRKNLFAFNTKLLSKRCGLIDENGNLLKAARVPKN